MRWSVFVCICAQVHRWVNYESMLKECLVGRMATKVTTAVKGKRIFTVNITYSVSFQETLPVTNQN